MINKAIPEILKYADLKGVSIMKTIKKLIRRSRIKKIFKSLDKLNLYKFYINSYNSCFEATLNSDEGLYRLMRMGILVVANAKSGNVIDNDYIYLFRMNPHIFKLIIF